MGRVSSTRKPASAWACACGFARRCLQKKSTAPHRIASHPPHLLRAPPPSSYNAAAASCSPRCPAVSFHLPRFLLHFATLPSPASMSLPKRSAAHAWRRQMRRHPPLQLMRGGRRVHQRLLEEAHHAQSLRARGEAGGVDEAVHSELVASCSSPRSTSLDLGGTGSISTASSAHVCFARIRHPQAKPDGMWTPSPSSGT